MDKWKIRDKDEKSAGAKNSTESLGDPKMEQQKLQSVTAPVLPSPKKQDGSNSASRTKENIGRASHHAIDCAKYSFAGEVSLISVIFQYGKQAAHFIFSYCGFLLLET